MLRKKSFNLAEKVAFTAVLLFTAGIVSMVYFSTITLEASLTRLLMDQQMSAVKYVANDLEQKILLRMNSLQDVANNLPANRIKDKKAIHNFLKQRIAIYRFLPMA